jgi:hypothetical protein
MKSDAAPRSSLGREPARRYASERSTRNGWQAVGR